MRESETPSNTRTVAKNFAWSGIEVFVSIVATLATTVAVARVIGPQRLGYFNYVYWLGSTTGMVGSLGIPMMTFKYMAEFLGAGNPALARSVFSRSLAIQSAIAVGLASVGEALVFIVGDPNYRWISAFLVLSIIPQMITFIPSQANAAAENLAANTRGSLIGMAINVAAVVLSLVMGWDLMGIAVGVFLYRSGELAAKLIPLQRWARTLPSVTLSPDIRRRMFTFSGRSTGLMLLQILVWDRSDIIFLKMLQSDIKQIAFFSISFSLAERLLLLPQAFANSLGATQMAQYGRDRNRLFRMTGLAATYMLMVSLPLLLGAACLSGPIVRVLYGPQYFPAISVFALVAVFAIPKGILGPAQTLLYSMEELGFLLKWGCACGALNVLLDIVLIPHHAAFGAAIANGTAQTMAAAGIWWYAICRHPLGLQPKILLKLTAASLGMSILVLIATFPPMPVAVKAALGVLTGAVVFVLLLRLIAVLPQEDRQRFLLIDRSLPGSLRPWFRRLVDFVVPAAATTENAASNLPLV
jgi:O-antigen/teichoic acid export membrane protein